jgi:CelD/BcsL family acetyltransferase involved in cellulose biosynthesis
VPPTYSTENSPLKSDQYRRTGRTDRFAQPWIVSLIEDLFGTRGNDFSGLFSVLYVGGTRVAAHLGVRAGAMASFWFAAYDMRFRQYSPGHILHLRMLEAVASTGIRQVDLGKGAKRYKETLKSSDIYVAEGAVTRRSPLGQAHRARIVPSQWAVRTIRAHRFLYEPADRLLKRYGRLCASPWALRGQAPGEK